MLVGFLVLWVSPISPLAQLPLATAVSFFHGDVSILIDVTDGNAWAFKDEFWLFKFKHPITDQKEAIDFTTELRDKDPVVITINIVVIADDNIFLSLDAIALTCNYIIVATEFSPHLIQVAFGKLNPAVDFDFVLLGGVEELEEAFESVDRETDFSKG